MFTSTCLTPCVPPSLVGGAATYPVGTRTATYTPSTPLEVGTTYTATITTAAAVTPSTPITVTSTVPAGSAAGIGPNAIVNPVGKPDLDLFASHLKGAAFDQITAIGHTDRIGSDAYNKKLSLRRAEAVKVYLVEATGLPAVK